MNNRSLYECIMKNVAKEVKKALNEGQMSRGWSMELMPEDFSQTILEIESLIYEINNCNRGSYTGYDTYEQLGEYITELGTRLSDCGAAISEIDDTIDTDVPYDEENLNSRMVHDDQIDFEDDDF